MKIEVPDDHQIFPWYDEYPPEVTETIQKRMWSIYIQKVKGFFVKGYLEEEIFKGGSRGACPW